MSISHYFNRTLRDNFEIHDINPVSDLDITGNAEIGGTIQVDTVANDDTENRLLVLNTADNVFEYRNVSSLPNPFDQDLNTFDPVEFDQVNINDNFLLSTFNDSFTRFHQTPAVTNNDKVFEFQTDTDTGAARIDLNNAGNKSSGLKLQTKTTSDGNAFIQYETGTNRWFEGINKTNNEFAIHYSPGDPTDNLYNAANERLSLSNTGDLTTLGSVNADALILQNVVNDDAETKLMTWDIVGKSCKFRNVSSLPVGNPFDQTLNQADPVDFLSVDINNNTLINSNSDSLSSFTQTPAITTGYKQFAFTSDTSDSPVVVEVLNADLTAAAHTGILLHNPSLGGGNQFIIYETPGEKEWTVGRQRTTDTFRWNNAISDSDEFLTVDANTKMSLSNTGELGLNTDNIIISASTDSLAGFAQLPAVTTGDKVFQFSSQTSDAESRLEIVNSTSSPTAHTCLAANSQLSGGNMFTKYLKIGFAQWASGYQSSTNTFRWNYDGTGTDNLTDDSKTKMHLSNTGTLSLNGDNIVITPSSDSITTFLQTPSLTTGTKDFIFTSDTSDNMAGVHVYNDNAGVNAHTGIYLRTDKAACTGNGGNQLIQYETCGLGGWGVGHQKSTNTFRWNWVTTASDYLITDANTRMKLTTAGDLTLTGQLYQKAEVVSLTSTAENTFVIDAITTKYVWTSTRGALTMASLGQANWTVTPTTGIAQLANYDDAVGTYFAVVNFSCSMKTTAGVDQNIEVTCRGAGTTSGFVPSAEWGAINQVINNTTDWHSVSFTSLVTISNTGWFEFTFANLSSSNNIQIKNARVTMIK